MTESKLLQVRIGLEALITQREWMVASNRQHCDCEPYSEKDFVLLLDSLSALLKEFEEPEKKKVRIVQNANVSFDVVDALSGRTMCGDWYDTKERAIQLCIRQGWEVVE